MREKLQLILSVCFLFHAGCEVIPQTGLNISCSGDACASGMEARAKAMESPGGNIEEVSRQSLVAASSTARVFEAFGPVAQVDFSQVPVWNDTDIQRVFEATRDARFLTFTTPETGLDFKRRIPWLFLNGGCAERAELVASMAGDTGLTKPYKLFVTGDLVVRSNNACGPQWPIVEFGYHVAPVIKNTTGQVLVLDPAINPSAPLPWRDWLKKQLYNVVEQRDGTDAELVNLQVALADSYAYERDSLVSGGPHSVGFALGESVRYLYQEWDCQVALGRDPVQILGDNPPWALSAHRDWPAKPANPSPSQDATDIVTAPTLAWDAGHGAASHAVYFGESPDQLVLVPPVKIFAMDQQGV